MSARNLFVASMLSALIVFPSAEANAAGETTDASLRSSYSAAETARKDAKTPAEMLAVIGQYETLAAAGHASSALRLGDIYLQGTLVDQDLNKAAANYQRAVDLGHTLALSKLGRSLLDAGRPEEAFTVYERAVKEGVPGVSLLWAKLHLRNAFGAKSDPALGLSELERLWAEGEEQAGVALAEAYRVGSDGDTELKESIQILERLAQSGDPLAIEKLALYYRQGYGVEGDLGKAISLYQEAVAKGRTSALIGLGTTQLKAGDGPAALASFEKAQDAGFKDVGLRIALGHITKAFGSASNVQAGIDVLRPAAEAGDANYAKAALDLLADGKKFLLDIPKVMQTAEEAAANGDGGAASALMKFARQKPRLVDNPVEARKQYLEKYRDILPERALATEEVALVFEGRSSRAARPELSKLLGGYTGDTYQYGLQQVFFRDKEAYTYLVQQELSKLGVYSGPVSGRLSSRTIRAILRFCNSNGIYDECIHGPMRGTAMRQIVDAIGRARPAVDG